MIALRHTNQAHPVLVPASAIPTDLAITQVTTNETGQLELTTPTRFVVVNGWLVLILAKPYATLRYYMNRRGGCERKH